MTHNRQAIPADTKRKLMIESGHRCAACGEAVSLEKAHIIPWHEKKEHEFEDLVVFCRVCHRRSHDEDWDRLTLREYKKHPWVSRYRSAPSPKRPIIAEFNLDLSPENFGDDERQRFLAAVSAALDTCPRELAVVRIHRGSTIVDVQMPYYAGKRLMSNASVIDKVHELISPLRLIRIDFPPLEDSPLEDDADTLGHDWPLSGTDEFRERDTEGPTNGEKATESEVLTIDLGEEEGFKSLVRAEFAQPTSLRIARGVLALFACVSVLCFVMAFLMFLQEGADHHDSLELVRMLFNGILPLVTLLVGYYLGERCFSVREREEEREHDKTKRTGSETRVTSGDKTGQL